MRLLLRFLSYLKGFKMQALAGLFTLLLGTLISIPVPLIYKYIIDVVLAQKNLMILGAFIVILLITTFFEKFINFIEEYLFSHIRKEIFISLRTQLYQQFQKLSIRYFSEKKSGGLLARVINDVNTLQFLLTDKLIAIVKDTLIAFFIIIILFFLDLKLILLAILILPFFAISFSFFGRKVFQASQTAQEKQEILYGDLHENITAAPHLQHTSYESYKTAQTHETISHAEEAHRNLILEGARASFSLIFINILGICLIWGFGGYQIILGEISIGTLIAISFYMSYLIMPMQTIFEANIHIQSALAGLKRIFEILDIIPDIKDAKDAQPLDPQKDITIEFRNVYFNYFPKVPLLEDINLVISPHEMIGIMGKSGEGKTTLANLLLRFWDITKGELLINGTDIKKIKLFSLRNLIALVPQDIFLFNSSIRDNILVGRNIAEPRFDEIIKLAGLKEFIRGLPEKYDTIVGEKGAKLSGGQKQRVAIARALAAEPKVIIFDEATSNLDPETEAGIKNTIRQINQTTSIVLISHKYSSLAIARGIYILKNGKLEESTKKR